VAAPKSAASMKNGNIYSEVFLMTFSEKADLIKTQCLKETGTDPIAIAIRLMAIPEISIHGPEHHMLDGSAFLTAYKNAGGKIDLAAALDELEKRSSFMPGATCGYWGVCGSAASVGSALAIIHGTGPLSDNEFYKDNLHLTSRCLEKIADLGGPRCCKRNAYLSITEATAFVKEKYGIEMKIAPFKCPYYPKNPTCLGKKCPFHP
jgi:hypothetical protein